MTTKAERGKSGKGETPQYAAVGSNTLNEITVLRATRALFLYVRQWMAEQGIFEQPRLGDCPRRPPFFQKVLSIGGPRFWSEQGGYSMIFDGPRSTPAQFCRSSSVCPCRRSDNSEPQSLARQRFPKRISPMEPSSDSASCRESGRKIRDHTNCRTPSFSWTKNQRMKTLGLYCRQETIFLTERRWRTRFLIRRCFRRMPPNWFLPPFMARVRSLPYRLFGTERSRGRR